MVDISETLRRGMAHHQAGRLADARAAYDEILDAVPDHADALHLTGLVEHQSGDHVAAVATIRRAIALDAKAPLYHANLGRVLRAHGEDAPAAAAYRDAIALAPDMADVHSDLAAALIALGDHEAARARAQRALELDPGMAEPHLNLGLALQGAGGPDAAGAEEALRRALDMEPGLAGGWLGLGILLQARGEAAAAGDAYAKALALDPGLVEAHVNLGNLKREACDFAEAVEHYRAGLELEPNNATAHGNLGVALQESGEVPAALAAYDAALALAPEDAEVQRNRAMALLQAGRFEEGWKAYEWRWKTRRFAGLDRHDELPRWHGEAALDATLMMHAEQGYGDAIQFARYLPLAAERVGRVVLQCPQPLTGLLATVAGAHTVVATGDALPACDVQVPLLSLPGVFRTELATVPADVPYLQADAATVARWRSWGDKLAGARVGLAWKGSAEHPRDIVRSPGLEVLRPLLDVPGVSFVSLQRDAEPEEYDCLDEVERARITDMAAAFVDFSDAAAVVAELDLVIACDTAMAHLAGALAKSVWVLLPHVAEWRWLEERLDSPWYPTARLFRQPAPGDWAGVVAEVRAALTKRSTSAC